MRLISWNVNGLRACLGKGFLDVCAFADADVICRREPVPHSNRYAGLSRRHRYAGSPKKCIAPRMAGLAGRQARNKLLAGTAGSSCGEAHRRPINHQRLARRYTDCRTLNPRHLAGIFHAPSLIRAANPSASQVHRSARSRHPPAAASRCGAWPRPHSGRSAP